VSNIIGFGADTAHYWGIRRYSLGDLTISARLTALQRELNHNAT